MKNVLMALMAGFVALTIAAVMAATCPGISGLVAGLLTILALLVVGAVAVKDINLSQIDKREKAGRS